MSESIVTRYYNDYWAVSEGWTPHPSLSPLKRKILTRWITRQSSVLDVGCGDGAHYGRLLATIAHAYYGLDVSQVAVDVARQSGILARQHDLGNAFPFPDEMFDSVICLEVLEHLFDPAFTLREICRVLKPNGCAILSVPNIAHFSNRARLLFGRFAPGGTPETSSRRPWADPHIRFFTLNAWRAFIAEQGLQIVALHGESFSLFSTIPLWSSFAARWVKWERLEQWSQPFEFMARLLPSLCAGHFLAIVTRRVV